MFDNAKIISWIRTVVPGAWGVLLAWVAGYVALPEEVVKYLNDPFTLVLVTGLAIGLWKGVFNWLEPKMPAWLTRIILGSNQTPSYDDTVDGSEPDQEDINSERFDEAAEPEEDSILSEVDDIAAPWLRGE